MSTHIESTLKLGPAAAGLSMTAVEFDAAEFERGPRYELIHGVLVVNPATSPQERGPNQQLGYLLLNYQQTHPLGSNLDDTLPEHDIHVGEDRRRADRAIWSGLGHQPRLNETPTIIAEFVSEGKRNLARDYDQKRDEYLCIGVKEYWVLNRFKRTLTVFRPNEEPLVLQQGANYQTPLLPGFSLGLSEIFAAADRWSS